MNQMKLTVSEGGEVRLIFEQLGDGLHRRFHDAVEHVNDALRWEMIGGHQTYAVGRVNAVGSVVQVDADFRFTVLRIQQLITKRCYQNISIIIQIETYNYINKKSKEI